MKLFQDKNFFYVQKNDEWYRTPKEDSNTYHKITDIDASGLTELPLSYIALPKFLTDCNICDNKGYHIGRYAEDSFICDCYHGQVHGERDLETELNPEDF